MKINRTQEKKINLLIRSMTKNMEDRLKHPNMKYSNYNSEGTFIGGMPLLVHLQNYIKQNIFPAYAIAKYSISYEEKMFYCNYLCILMYSFIELYAQTLNVFYDLKLLPLHNMPANSPITVSTGVVEQSIRPLPYKDESVVSMKKVLMLINKNYKTNEYYEEIRNILKCAEISRLKALRNYQMHYQSIFSRYTQNYSLVNGKKVFTMNVNSKDKPINEREYVLFMELAESILEKEIELIYFFAEMIVDKKLIKCGEDEEEVCIVQCECCSKQFTLPQIAIEFFKTMDYSIPHDRCEGRVSLESIRTIRIHPERWNSILLECLDMISNGKV